MALTLPSRWIVFGLLSGLLAIAPARADDSSRPLTMLLFEAPDGRTRPLVESLRIYTQDVPCKVASLAWPGSADEALSVARREGAAFALWIDDAAQPEAIEVRRIDPPADHRVPVSPDDVRARFTPAALRIRAFVVAQSRPVPEPVSPRTLEEKASPAPVPPAPEAVEALPVPAAPAPVIEPVPEVPRPMPSSMPVSRNPWLWLEARGGATFDPFPSPLGLLRVTAWPRTWLGVGLEGAWRRGPQAALDVSGRFAWGAWSAWAGPRLEARFSRTRSSETTTVVPVLGVSASAGYRMWPSVLIVGGLTAAVSATTTQVRDGRGPTVRSPLTVEATAGVAWEPF